MDPPGGLGREWVTQGPRPLRPPVLALAPGRWQERECSLGLSCSHANTRVNSCLATQGRPFTLRVEGEGSFLFKCVGCEDLSSPRPPPPNPIEGV